MLRVGHVVTIQNHVKELMCEGILRLGHAVSIQNPGKQPRGAKKHHALGRPQHTF